MTRHRSRIALFDRPQPGIHLLQLRTNGAQLIVHGGRVHGCLTGRNVLVATTPGAALLTAGLLGLAGWLVKAATTAADGVALPALAGLVVAAVVSPWLVLAGLACLAALRAGGESGG